MLSVDVETVIQLQLSDLALESERKRDRHIQVSKSSNILCLKMITLKMKCLFTTEYLLVNSYIENPGCATVK